LAESLLRPNASIGRASIERERAVKKAEGLAKLAQWKADNPELVEAQKALAKLKRKCRPKRR
jgi:hypothetical protein